MQNTNLALSVLNVSSLGSNLPSSKYATTNKDKEKGRSFLFSNDLHSSGLSSISNDTEDSNDVKALDPDFWERKIKAMRKKKDELKLKRKFVRNKEEKVPLSIKQETSFNYEVFSRRNTIRDASKERSGISRESSKTDLPSLAKGKLKIQNCSSKKLQVEPFSPLDNSIVLSVNDSNSEKQYQEYSKNYSVLTNKRSVAGIGTNKENFTSPTTITCLSRMNSKSKIFVYKKSMPLSIAPNSLEATIIRKEAPLTFETKNDNLVRKSTESHFERVNSSRIERGKKMIPATSRKTDMSFNSGSSSKIPIMLSNSSRMNKSALDAYSENADITNPHHSRKKPPLKQNIFTPRCISTNYTSLKNLKQENYGSGKSTNTNATYRATPEYFSNKPSLKILDTTTSIKPFDILTVQSTKKRAADTLNEKINSIFEEEKENTKHVLTQKVLFDEKMSHFLSHIKNKFNKIKKKDESESHFNIEEKFRVLKQYSKLDDQFFTFSSKNTCQYRRISPFLHKT